MDWTSTGLRVLRAVAERGSFSGAAESLGYTQSAVSRQVSSLEHAAGEQLFVRSSNGARLTEAGRILLASATQALNAVDAGYDELHGRPSRSLRLRIGVFTTAAMVLLPAAIARLQREHPGLAVESREGGSVALVRSLRAGTIDAAIIGQQHPFVLAPDPGAAVETTPLMEGDLVVAVPEHSPVGVDGGATLAELATLAWISGPSGEIGLGAWPGLPQRPPTTHQAKDWTTKFALVAAGLGATTVPPYFETIMPAGIRLVTVRDGQPIRRRVTLAWVETRRSPYQTDLEICLRDLASELAP